ncbi:MAG: ATP-binding protein [Desulfobacterales bacterium]|nr:ATP-binding protein [Desulfobacterales bacterium]
MKSFRILSAILIFLLMGIGILSNFLQKFETKSHTRDVINRGLHIVSLLSLYPMKDFKDSNGDYFLRTLTEYSFYKELAYFFVHDATGAVLLSMAPDEIASKIPGQVSQTSLFAAGLINQAFKTRSPENTIYEFAKPLYSLGKRSGVIRMGLKLSPVSIFSSERLSLMAVLAFFIVGTAIICYFAITGALKNLKSSKPDFSDFSEANDLSSGNIPRKGNVASVISHLDESLVQYKAKLDKLSAENVELSSRLGVFAFEKNRIITLLDALDFGVILTDLQNHVTHVNKFMLTLLGKTRKHVIDHDLYEIIEHAEIRSYISRHEGFGHSANIQPFETTLPDHAPAKIFKVILSYLTADGNSLSDKVLSFIDVTSVKSAEDAKQSFIAHVSHELLTPLTNIKSYSEMLMDGEVENMEMQKEFYNTINDETNRLARLVQNLLNLTKMEMGNLVIDKSLVKTDWLLGDCIKSVEAAAHDKKITINSKIPDNFPTLIADKELLKGAIINLLGNAVKYSPENATITFAISEQDQVVSFDITDTGHGISEKDLPHIFEKFYRADDDKVRTQMGSGLGLAITAEIVQLHNGEITVQSELGKGTHFSIRIPKEEYYLAKE